MRRVPAGPLVAACCALTLMAAAVYLGARAAEPGRARMPRSPSYDRAGRHRRRSAGDAPPPRQGARRPSPTRRRRPRRPGRATPRRTTLARRPSPSWSAWSPATSSSTLAASSRAWCSPDGSQRTITAGTSGTLRPLDASSVFEIGSIAQGLHRRPCSPTWCCAARSRSTTPWRATSRATSGCPARASGRSRSPTSPPTRPGCSPTRPCCAPPIRPGRSPSSPDLEQLYAMVDGYRLPRAVGAESRYSNAGFGLLGIALARRAGTSYERLLRERVLLPLELARTGTARAWDGGAAVVQGHDERGDATPPYATPAFPGAGDLRADLDDLLAFAAANLEPTARSARRWRSPRSRASTSIALRASGSAGSRCGSADGRCCVHDASTAGFSSVLVLDRGAPAWRSSSSPAPRGALGRRHRASTPCRAELVDPPAGRRAGAHAGGRARRGAALRTSRARTRFLTPT